MKGLLSCVARRYDEEEVTLWALAARLADRSACGWAEEEEEEAKAEPDHAGATSGVPCSIATIGW